VTPMPPPTLAVFTQTLSDAASLPEALHALRGQLDDAAKGLQLSYFVFDSRKQVVCERYRVTGDIVEPQPLQVSLDHLPARLRRDLLAGGALVDFGEQSADYLRFFGMDDPSDGYLLAQGIRANGELSGIVAVREPRQRFGSRAVDRIAAPVGVFALAVALYGERAARQEAEESLERIVSRIHAEHGQATAALQRELDEARRQLTADGVDAKVAELQRAAKDATDRARGAAARLQAVEQQVATAVAELEKAHVDLSRQSETLREQGNMLHRLQRLLADSAPARDPREVLQEVLAAVSGNR
jgi:signal transduction histidine kinase